MNKEEFIKSLHLGLGRAIIFAQQNDVSEFRDVILDACLHCYSYDKQCEGTRSLYMADLVSALADKEFYIEQVLSNLGTSDDSSDTVQKYEFATYFAQKNYAGAKEKMYESFSFGSLTGSSVALCFIQLDGLEGFLFCANKLSTSLSYEDDLWEAKYLVSRAFELCGKEETLRALKEEAAFNPTLALFLEAGSPAQSEDGSLLRHQHREEIKSASYQKLKLILKDNFSRPLLSLWAKHAPNEELIKAAQALLSAEDWREIKWHLLIFSETPFPLSITKLLELSKSSDRQIAYPALRALSCVSDPAIREVAFELFANNKIGRGASIKLLTSNFLPGDHVIALQWFQAETDLDIKHSLGMDCFDLCKKHEDPIQAETLNSIYESGPCSMCRETSVRQLIKLGKMTEAKHNECRYDCNSSIRELV